MLVDDYPIFTEEKLEKYWDSILDTDEGRKFIALLNL